MSRPVHSAVLVTGGTGFLGSAVVRALAARGVETHVLARSSSPRSVLAGLEPHWHEGDLRDPASLARAVAATVAAARARGGRAAVVHSAAVISYASADGPLQEEVNVRGTERLLAAARAGGVERVVHVSSVVAVGSSPDGTPIDEEAPFDLAGCGVDYVRTKRAAEELALAAASTSDVVVVNPGAIFGPRARDSNSARFLREIAAGGGPPLAPPGGVGVVGVDDTAEGVVLALERGRRGRRYLLVESNLRLLELFRLVARLCGRRSPARAALPRAAWPLVLAGARTLDRLRPIALAPPQALVLLGRVLAYDSSRARQELGWSPRPFALVLAETLEALRLEPRT